LALSYNLTKGDFMEKENQTAAVVKAWYENLSQGNIEAVINGLAEDVEWDIPKSGYNLILPWVGKCKGRAAVVEAFKLRDAVATITAFEPKEFIVEGNRAVVLVSEKGVCNHTGAEFVLDMVQIMTVKGGLIASWQVYNDPTTIVTAFRAQLPADLIDAVDNDDVQQVATLLLQGADPNTRDQASGLTVLMLAACHANVGIVKLLLDAGADVLTTDVKTGATPLHKACQGGNLEIARLLLDAGAFFDAITPTMGHTPLMDALWYKWPEICSLLIERGTNLQFGTHYGFALDDHINFELNVNQGEEKQAFLILKQMIDTKRAANQKTIAAQTVMAATSKGDAPAVRQLISEGAEVNTNYPHVNSFLDGHTPLLVAARDGHAEIVKMLLAAGAEVLVEDWVFKGAPMHKATYNGRPDILKMLVEHPGVDINVQGPINGYTPLHDALWHGFIECSEILVNAGARLDLKGDDGKTPLDIALAVCGKESSIVKLINAKMLQA
jgi:ankyrin repeat protein